MYQKIGLLLLLMCLFAGMTACGGNNGATPAPPETNAGTPDSGANGNTAAADAEAVYKAQCIGCHAADLSGGVGPNLQKIGAELSQDKIAAQIENGGGGMPAFKSTLSADQIAALSQWLAAHK
ncbi:c-type cytochrome [Paenibacillus humicola]|uniref:c-type cytochrome n=1 Tax=Paenibacillus humicola TaxID=3110540 RepID=UPI00237B1D59|nr:cytochrome c [Paenibacillus humicola]